MTINKQILDNLDIMQDAEVSIYKDVLDTEGESISISTILKGIKTGRWKDKVAKIRSIQDENIQKDYKNSLPCFTGSGVFSRRKTDGLIAHSSRIILDIDAKDNPILLGRFDEVRKQLIADRHTCFLFTSCRGNGLAGGVKIDGSRHVESFQYLEDYYKKTYGLTIDKGCKDVTRLRYISYDPDLYSSESAETVILPPDFFKEPKRSHTNLFSNVNGKNHEIMKAIIDSGKLLGDDSYESWLKVGFALAQEFGETGRGYFHELSKISSKYDPVACDRKFDDCLRNNRGDVTFGTIVHLAKEAGIVFKNASLWTPIFDNFDNFDEFPKDIFENVIPEYSFPFEIFPEKIQEVIKNYSEALSVEPEIIAHNMLVLASAAIGNSTRIESKSSHIEPLFLWGALIQPTGLGKTHAINALMKPIENKQAEAYQKHLKDLKKYKEYLRQSKENEKNQKKTIRKGKENDY